MSEICSDLTIDLLELSRFTRTIYVSIFSIQTFSIVFIVTLKRKCLLGEYSWQRL